MMELTYEQARATVLDHTETGYTIASQDRLWTVFIFDQFDRLYSTGVGSPWSYEMWDEELMWTSRSEAEAFAERVRERLAKSHLEGVHPSPPEAYVINWGDDSRFEATLIGRAGGARPRTTPKFKGSEKAWAALTEMHNRWMEAHA